MLSHKNISSEQYKNILESLKVLSSFNEATVEPPKVIPLYHSCTMHQRRKEMATVHTPESLRLKEKLYILQ